MGEIIVDRVYINIITFLSIDVNLSTLYNKFIDTLKHICNIYDVTYAQYTNLLVYVKNYNMLPDKIKTEIQKLYTIRNELGDYIKNISYIIHNDDHLHYRRYLWFYYVIEGEFKMVLDLEVNTLSDSQPCIYTLSIIFELLKKRYNVNYNTIRCFDLIYSETTD